MSTQRKLASDTPPTPLKIQRVASMATYSKIQSDLDRLIPKYLAKSKCRSMHTIPEDITNAFLMGCNNPYIMNAVLVDDGTDPGTAVGFLTCQMQSSLSTRMATVGNFYSPAGHGADILRRVITWMQKHWDVAPENVLMVTFREGSAMEKLLKGSGLKFEVIGYLLGHTDHRRKILQEA